MKEPPAPTASWEGNEREDGSASVSPGKHRAEQGTGRTGLRQAWALGSPWSPIGSDCDPVAPLSGLPFLTAN